MTRNAHFARLGFNAIADIGIIVIAHFKNPARTHAAKLLLEALTLQNHILIPVSAYLGAYIIMTEYLKLRSTHVAKALLKTLSLESPAFYEEVPKGIAEKAIATASELKLSSWDTYLVELAKGLRIKKIYTIDRQLATKIEDVKVENPIPENAMRKYHQYIRERVDGDLS